MGSGPTCGRRRRGVRCISKSLGKLGMMRWPQLPLRGPGLLRRRGRGGGHRRARADLQLDVFNAGGRLYNDCSGLRVRRGHGEEVKSLEVPCHLR